ncbi:MAG: polyphenol oxidase family protein [Acidobacteriota bacterium]
MNVFSSNLLRGIPRVACAFFGRGSTPRPLPSRLLSHLRLPGPGPHRVVTARQIHSNRCLVVDAGAAGDQTAGEADALVTSNGGLVLGITTADCLPIVAIDPRAGVLGVVHAGWKGTLAGVLANALSCMAERCGARPDAMLVAVGPGAHRCCYTIGDAVEDRFRRAFPSVAGRIIQQRSGATYLDLVEANRLQALDAGVSPDHFEALGICSICRPARCHSFRRDGARAGRMWLLAAMVE